MTPARALMHRLAAVAKLPPPDENETQWYLSIGAATLDAAAAGAAADATEASMTHVSVMLEDSADLLIMSATLGTTLHAHPARFWRHLLGLNAALLNSGRGAMTTDPRGHVMYLMQPVDGTVCVGDDIAALFETFVAQARHLVDVLNDTLPLDTAHPEAALPKANGPPSHQVELILPV